MILKQPFLIGSRLIPSLKVNDGWLSLRRLGRDEDGRRKFCWYADIPAGSFYRHDLASGVGSDPGYQEMFETFLTFLLAAVESYNYKGWEGENSDLFPKPVVEWAAENKCEIEALHWEISEIENLIEEP